MIRNTSILAPHTFLTDCHKVTRLLILLFLLSFLFFVFLSSLSIINSVLIYKFVQNKTSYLCKRNSSEKNILVGTSDVHEKP